MVQMSKQAYYEFTLMMIPNCQKIQFLKKIMLLYLHQSAKNLISFSALPNFYILDQANTNKKYAYYRVFEVKKYHFNSFNKWDKANLIIQFLVKSSLINLWRRKAYFLVIDLFIWIFLTFNFDKVQLKTVADERQNKNN